MNIKDQMASGHPEPDRLSTADGLIPYNLSELDRLRALNAELLTALEAATQRMEAVADSIPVENRAKGISQATHVRHMAGHLAQHAKIARAALANAGV